MDLPLTWDGPGGLKLRHMKILSALDGTRNMHAAASLLSISQPAASRLLSEIERLVGEPIFVRHAKGLTPNTYGEILIRRAKFALSEIARASDEIAQIKSGFGGVVSIGALTSPAVGIAADAILRFQESHPKVRVDFEHDISPPLMRKLLDGRLDFVLCRVPLDVAEEALECTTVASEEFVFLVRDGHPALRTERLSLAEILPYPWILQSPGTLLRQRFDAELRARGLSLPERVLNTSSVLFALALLAKGDGVAVVSAQVADLFARDGQFRRLTAIEHEPRLLFEPFALIRHRQRELSPAADVFYRIFRELIAETKAGRSLAEEVVRSIPEST